MLAGLRKDSWLDLQKNQNHLEDKEYSELDRIHCRLRRETSLCSTKISLGDLLRKSSLPNPKNDLGRLVSLAENLTWETSLPDIKNRLGRLVSVEDIKGYRD